MSNSMAKNKSILETLFLTNLLTGTEETRSHPEMVGDMSCVTLNSDLSKIPFVHF